MSDMTRITPEQEAILNTFTCERLTENPANRDLCYDFTNEWNKGLVDKLRKEAWNEDLDGLPAAYYVVKNPEGRIALYFSLQCGTMCDPAYVAKVLERYDNLKEKVEELQNPQNQEWGCEYPDQIRNSSSTISYMDRMMLYSEYYDAKADRKDIKNEKRKEPNPHLLRVDESFPAIELVHFCANDNARSAWDDLKLGRSMGEVLFWKFVVPKMQEINKLIGCEYVYLFAADLSPDAALVNYYETALHFELPTTLSGIKPRYDYLCTFMCKRLSSMSWYRRSNLKPSIYEGRDSMGLTDYRELFFENFNEVPTME